MRQEAVRPQDVAAELARAREQQRAVAQILRALGQSPVEIVAVFQAIVDAGAQLMHAGNCALFRREGNMLRLLAQAKGAGPLLHYYSEHPIAIDRSSLTARSIIEGRTLHLPDTSKDPELRPLQDRPEFLAAAGRNAAPRPRSTLAVPLIQDGEALGALHVTRWGVIPFTESEIELAETFAAQALIAMENARLFNETKEAVEHQTAIADVLRIISATTSADV